MIGIYKITSPSKRVYIGQSINIESRIKQYSKLKCVGQKKLYNSFLKHGFDKHTIVILEFCEISELNDKERYYQDLYSSTNKNGLNLRLTRSADRSGKISQEVKDKISIGNKLSHENRRGFCKVRFKINYPIVVVNVKESRTLKIDNKHKILNIYKTLFRDSGLTQVEISEIFNTSQQNISKISKNMPAIKALSIAMKKLNINSIEAEESGLSVKIEML